MRHFQNVYVGSFGQVAVVFEIVDEDHDALRFIVQLTRESGLRSRSLMYEETRCTRALVLHSLESGTN